MNRAPTARLAPHLLVLLLAGGLALAATWPLALHALDRVPGDLWADRDQNLWNLWWIKTALLGGPTNPYHTPLLYYPGGTDLYVHTLALPNGLLALLPQLVAGLPAAYNLVLLFHLTLAIYGGYRLARYVVQRDQKDAAPGPATEGAAFLAGCAYGLAAYSLDALKGQPEVLATGWLPLYGEAWLRAWDGGGRRASPVAGVLFVITALTNFYYALYLALFTLGHLVWTGIRAARGGTGRAWGQRVITILPSVALPLLLLLPYVLGVATSLAGGTFALSAGDQQGRNSADLLNFLVPPRTHPWLGAATPWWSAINPALHDPLWIGWVAPLLALIGLVARRRQAAGWALGVAGAALLALGATLHINGNAQPGGLSIPLPWALLQGLPVFNLVGKVDRFLVLARLCLVPLVAWGALALLAGRPFAARKGLSAPIALAALCALLLLVDVPWRAQPLAGVLIPSPLAALAAVPKDARGALLELPLATGQVQTMGARMRYQTAHGWPVIGGYLARSPADPLPECAPVWGLITWEPGVAARDVITPHVMSAPLALMQRLAIRYLAVYNVYDPQEGNALAPGELANFHALAAATTDPAPLASDALLTLYRVRRDVQPAPGPALQLGGGWGAREEAAGAPFRWLAGADAALCVQGGAGRTVRLLFEATSFASPRTLVLALDGAPVLTATIPADGQFTRVQTPPLTLGGDSARLTLHIPEGTTRPSDLGGSADRRLLSLGFRLVRLEDSGAGP